MKKSLFATKQIIGFIKQQVTRVRPKAAPGALDVKPSKKMHRLRFPGCAWCAYPGYTFSGSHSVRVASTRFG